MFKTTHLNLVFYSPTFKANFAEYGILEGWKTRIIAGW